jgi:hypothetical protein
VLATRSVYRLADEGEQVFYGLLLQVLEDGIEYFIPCCCVFIIKMTVLDGFFVDMESFYCIKMRAFFLKL